MADTPQQADYFGHRDGFVNHAAQLARHLEDKYAVPRHLGNGPSHVKNHMAAYFNEQLMDQLARNLYAPREVEQVTGGTRTFASFPRLDELLENAQTLDGTRNLSLLFETYLGPEKAAELAVFLAEDMRALKVRRTEFNEWMQREAELESKQNGPKGWM